MTLILGIDPGLASGISIYDTEDQQFRLMDQIPDGISGQFKPYFLSALAQCDHMVCENFTLRSSNKFTADLSGVEIIGWLKGEKYWGQRNPEPVQHMTLTGLRKNKDDYAKSPVTKIMKAQGYRIRDGHSRMAGSAAIWYAAKVLNHQPTLRMLSELRK